MPCLSRESRAHAGRARLRSPKARAGVRCQAAPTPPERSLRRGPGPGSARPRGRSASRRVARVRRPWRRAAPSQNRCAFALLFFPLFYSGLESSVLSTDVEPKREEKKKMDTHPPPPPQKKQPPPNPPRSLTTGRAPSACRPALTSSNGGWRGPREQETPPPPYLRPGRRGWGPSPERAALGRAAGRGEPGPAARRRRLLLAPAAG